MVTIDRMELADVASPKKLAEAVLRLSEVDLDAAVPVEEIASALDVLEIAELTSKGFEGALITDANKSAATILTRRGQLSERRRFTVGHELGHFLIPWHVPPGGQFQCTTKDLTTHEAPALASRPKWEAEANTFSAELLMPSRTFQKRAIGRNGLNVEEILRAAAHFKVSKHAAVLRAARLAGEAAAILTWKDGQLLSVFRAGEFPFVRLRPGMRSPAGTLSYEYRGDDDAVSAIEETSAALWCTRDDACGAMYEQVLVQSRGYRLTLLVAELEESDEDDD